MIDELRRLEADAQKEMASAPDAKTLEDLKIKYLGRKGLFASISAGIAALSPEDKREAGREMNRVKRSIEELFRETESRLGGPGADRQKPLDATMPGTFHVSGTLHPLTQVILDIADIFRRLGFSLVEGPEVESEYYNFEALNIPLRHPARDSFDTFYLANGRLLRSQTSTVQIRVMEKTKPPLKILAPGKVFRPDATDATHSFMFHQIEGLAVDRETSFADLKGVLLAFAREFFGRGTRTRMRFRPHFFPFTEPSAEIDLWHPSRGWIEILGAGMVHPNVLKAGGIDPKKWSGFAFGMGVERIAMMKYGVEDIRMFFENDLRFLKQFR